ncbi:hypothetical protein [Bacillus altitudinis]|uniref:hypothetical protein n=1 Tax=Bacillus altitudinis TaxID=293387 RepID=UPI003315C039
MSLSITTSSKVELTKEQAKAVEEGVKYYELHGMERGVRLNRLFVFEHWLVKRGDTPPWELLFTPLNDVDPHDLMSALTNGYVVKEEQR